MTVFAAPGGEVPAGAEGIGASLTKTPYHGRTERIGVGFGERASYAAARGASAADRSGGPTTSRRSIRSKVTVAPSGTVGFPMPFNEPLRCRLHSVRNEKFPAGVLCGEGV